MGALPSWGLETPATLIPELVELVPRLGNREPLARGVQAGERTHAAHLAARVVLPLVPEATRHRLKRLGVRFQRVSFSEVEIDHYFGGRSNIDAGSYELAIPTKRPGLNGCAGKELVGS